MPRFDDYSFEQFIALQSRLHEQLPRVTSFEQVAQQFMEALYLEFHESVVLARTYITVPHGKLPADVQQSVRQQVRAKGMEQLLKPDTPVLALAGTAGQEQDWTDRKKSRGHAGIPLLSSSFVESIPMVTRLLNEMGLGLSWIDDHDSLFFERVTVSRIFYVPDAATAVDSKRRKVIPAQDFVTNYQVKTVFGVGGSFIMRHGALMVVVVFCSEPVKREIAQWFSAVVTRMVATTFPAVQAGAIFRP